MVEDPDLKPDVNDGHKTASSSGWEVKVCVVCVCVCACACVCVCVCVCVRACCLNYAHTYIWLYSLF